MRNMIDECNADALSDAPHRQHFSESLRGFRMPRPAAAAFVCHPRPSSTCIEMHSSEVEKSGALSPPLPQSPLISLPPNIPAAVLQALTPLQNGSAALLVGVPVQVAQTSSNSPIMNELVLATAQQTRLTSSDQVPAAFLAP
jgi:hypothetical protein